MRVKEGITLLFDERQLPTRGTSKIQSHKAKRTDKSQQNHLANMKRFLLVTDEWLRRRIRMCIWKAWKKAKIRVANLIRCGINKYQAYEWGRISNGTQNRKCRMRNLTYGGVRGRKTKVGRKLLRFPPTRLSRMWMILWRYPAFFFFIPIYCIIYDNTFFLIVLYKIFILLVNSAL